MTKKKSKKEGPPRVRLQRRMMSLRVPEDLLDALYARADAEYTTMTAVLVAALRKHLKAK